MHCRRIEDLLDMSVSSHVMNLDALRYDIELIKFE